MQWLRRPENRMFSSWKQKVWVDFETVQHGERFISAGVSSDADH